MLAKPYQIDVTNTSNQSFQAAGTTWSLAQQVGKAPKHSREFPGSGSNGLLVATSFDQSAQCADPVFDLVEDNRKAYAGESGPQHGIPQLVVFALDLVDEWLKYVIHLVLAGRFAKFLKRLFDALRFGVPGRVRLVHE